jgi:hypothetical protein
MHEQGIIGYFAGKNGAGIRIFLNRATGSIGVRAPAASKKILPFVHGSNSAGAGSTIEPAFNDSFADLEVLETDLNPHAPKNGADKSTVVKTSHDPKVTPPRQLPQNSGPVSGTRSSENPQVEIPVGEIVSRLRSELEPTLQSAARQVAAQEHERTREWLESRGLPKAARVAQREAYNVLRQYGIIKAAAQSSHTAAVCPETSACEGRPLSDSEVDELAEACVSMLEAQGRAVEVTLSEMSVAAGGFLLPEDTLRVRAKAEAVLGNR